MTLLEKINSAQTKRDLDFLAMEVILSKDHVENTKAFMKKLAELEGKSEWKSQKSTSVIHSY
jgi:hypothetical protein